MKGKMPLVFSVLLGGLYLLPAVVLRDADWMVFKLGLLGLPIFLIQMLGWFLFGTVGQIILTTLFLGFIGWIIGLGIRRFVFK